jgi:hypothetical protein
MLTDQQIKDICHREGFNPANWGLPPEKDYIMKALRMIARRAYVEGVLHGYKHAKIARSMEGES